MIPMMNQYESEAKVSKSRSIIVAVIDLVAIVAVIAGLFAGTTIMDNILGVCMGSFFLTVGMRIKDAGRR